PNMTVKIVLPGLAISGAVELHSRTLPSAAAVASVPPSGVKATDVMWLGCGNSRISWRLSPRYSRTEPPDPPAANIDPSGLTATALTQPPAPVISGPDGTGRSMLLVSHVQTVVSRLPP